MNTDWKQDGPWLIWRHQGKSYRIIHDDGAHRLTKRWTETFADLDNVREVLLGEFPTLHAAQKAATLDAIPDPVIQTVTTALREITRLERERAGYHKLGLGDRNDAKLDELIKPYRVVVDMFEANCESLGISAALAISALQEGA